MYNDIADFMGTLRKIVTVNRDLSKNYMNYGAKDVLTQNQGGEDLEAIMDVSVRLVDSTYSAIQIVISFLYHQSVIERPAELRGGISLYWKG